MTLAEINRIAEIFLAADSKIPVCPHIWREMMISKSIGKVDKKALAKGKIKPVEKGSVSAKIGRKAKADRTVKGLKANREKRK